MFKELLDFLKNKQNESLISFTNIFTSLDESNTDELNNMDNLKKIENEKSNSVLEAYNKLHFIISNIKKQLDLLVNQLFRLNEIKIKQSLGKYKLEELLLFCDNGNLFDIYKNKLLYSSKNNFINKYLINIIEAIKKYPDLYDILIKESENFNLSDDITNYGYVTIKENNNKVDKTKLNIIQRLIELKYNLQNINIKNFESFFKNLQNKIDNNISEIKNKNNKKINNEEFTNMLNQVFMNILVNASQSIKEKGILIKQTSPYEMQLCITKDAITEYSAGETHTIRANDNPAVHSLLNLLLKLMTLDDTVADDFDYKLTGDKSRYTVTLSPKDANLKNFFEEITIDGSEYIDSLIIRGTHGDVTSMKFSDYDFSDKAVNSEDLKYFE